MDLKEVAIHYAKVNPPPPFIRIEKRCFDREKTETLDQFGEGMNTCKKKTDYFGLSIICSV